MLRFVGSHLQNADALEAKYLDVSTRLGLKYNQTKMAKERADSLRLRAARLYQGTYEKIERLRSEYWHLQFVFASLADQSTLNVLFSL